MFLEDGFSIDVATRAMGPGSQRWRQDRANGAVFGSDLQALGVDPKKHAAPRELGPGAKLHLTEAAIMQGAIGVRLIKLNFKPERAYLIGGVFAYTGATTAEGGEHTERTPDFVRERASGRLFGQGLTWLVADQEYPYQDGGEGFCFFSDADPRFAPDGRRSTLSEVIIAGGGVGGDDPRVLMNISGVAFMVGSGLNLPPNTAFEAQGVADA